MSCSYSCSNNMPGDQGRRAVSNQHVRKLQGGAGVCAEELPWVALKVSKRVSHLKKLLQEATKLHRDGHQALYEKEGQLHLRVSPGGMGSGAWKKCFSAAVVERYRPGVQTLQVAVIADITEEDCRALETRNDEVLEMAAGPRPGSGCAC